MGVKQVSVPKMIWNDIAKQYIGNVLALDPWRHTSALVTIADVRKKCGRGWTISKLILDVSIVMRMRRICCISINPEPLYGLFTFD